MKEQIFAMLRELNPYEEIDENSKLLEDKILDSLTLFILINELEHIFHIKIPEERLNPEQFGTVTKIEVLVRELCENNACEEG